VLLLPIRRALGYESDTSPASGTPRASASWMRYL